MSEEQKKQTESMREYLRLKKLQSEDKSEELIEEVYTEVKKTKNNQVENER